MVLVTRVGRRSTSPVQVTLQVYLWLVCSRRKEITLNKSQMNCNKYGRRQHFIVQLLHTIIKSLLTYLLTHSMEQSPS